MIFSYLQKILSSIERKSYLNELRKWGNIPSKNIKIGQNNLIHCKEGAKINIKEGLDIRNGTSIVLMENAQLKIGKNFFMNNYCSLNVAESIEIGENVLFGEGVRIYDHNHAYQKDPHFEVKRNEFTSAPVKIGNNCWLGSNVVVLKGVSIGDNCIIGAGCVVYKDVVSNTTIVNNQSTINL